MKHHDATHDTHAAAGPSDIGRGLARDPVCGMTVNPAAAAAEVEYEGTRYYFCSSGCAAKFRADPARYVTVRAADPGATPRGSEPRPPSPPGTTYTCPMHPEIIRDRPGACPICGMALEPRTVTLDEAENPELVAMRRRFWWSTLLTVPVVAIAMRHLLPGDALARIVPHELPGWLEMLLATPVVLWGGWPFFVRAWRSVVTWNLNMYTLIGLGVAVAYTYSLVARFFPSIFPASFRTAAGEVGVYIE